MNKAKYSIQQTANESTKKFAYYSWSVWIENGEGNISDIREVEYHLHPTFKKRVVRRKSQKNKFKLNSGGWGEFMITVLVLEKSGDIIQLSHWLKLGTNAPIKDDSKISLNGLNSVFISYTTPDSRNARKLGSLLSEAGIEVKSDWEILPGKSIEEYVQNSITQSDVFVAITPELASNNSNWQALEMQTALNLGKKPLIIASGSVKRIIETIDKKEAIKMILENIKIE